jgi:hypothetical protein
MNDYPETGTPLEKAQFLRLSEALEPSERDIANVKRHGKELSDARDKAADPYSRVQARKAAAYHMKANQAFIASDQALRKNTDYAHQHAADKHEDAAEYAEKAGLQKSMDDHRSWSDEHLDKAMELWHDERITPED